MPSFLREIRTQVTRIVGFIVCCLCFSFTVFLPGNSPFFRDRKYTPVEEKNPITMLECRNDNPLNGLFHRIMRIVEWLYCVKQEGDFGLYINLHNCYGFQGNTFPVLFKEINEEQITTFPSKNCSLQRNNFPSTSGLFKKYYVTEGLKNYNGCIYVYSDAEFIKDPDFQTFRERLHPIVSQYIRPASDLQDRIDAIMQKLDSCRKQNSSSTPNVKIGIHVRCMEHYANCHESPEKFLDDIERDIDHIMGSRDLENTSIFLATLCEPVVERISAKYNVVVCDIPRIPSVMGDWTILENANELQQARDAIVDTWCLASCDELWASSSNMTVFAGCLNPNLKIYMLPSLEIYNGN